MVVTCPCHEKIFDSEASLQNHLDLQAGKLTDRAVQAVLSAVRQGKGPLQAARVAGIPPEVWSREMKSNTILQTSLKLAEAEFAETVEEALAENAKEGEFRSATFWLERRNRDKWSPTAQKVEVSILESVKALPLAERRERLLQMLETRVLSNPEVLDVDVIEDV